MSIVKVLELATYDRSVRLESRDYPVNTLLRFFTSKLTRILVFRNPSFEVSGIRWRRKPREHLEPQLGQTGQG
ncbi:MAG: hypothetical protein QXJ23_10225, partial [Thermofilum sp.]|uniref:hypothetical protein n=1 Tax=Thermofilum sp. TaxID=1961369 RepID=UPI003181D5AC